MASSLARQLCIDFDAEVVTEEGIESAITLAVTVIPEGCKVKEAFGEASRHFGYARVDIETPLGNLVRRWTKTIPANCPYYSALWIEASYAEMARGMLQREAETSWHLMKSARTSVGWWLLPIINHVRTVPQENNMEFDIYLYRVPIDDRGQPKTDISD